MQFLHDIISIRLTTHRLIHGAQVISCPAVGCDILVDELTVTRLIGEPEVLRKYQYLAAKAFVAKNKRLKWCPAPGCDNAVTLSSARVCDVACNRMRAW